MTRFVHCRPREVLDALTVGEPKEWCIGVVRRVPVVEVKDGSLAAVDELLWTNERLSLCRKTAHFVGESPGTVNGKIRSYEAQDLAAKERDMYPEGPPRGRCCGMVVTLLAGPPIQP